MTEEKELHKGHRQRLRERYASGGPESFQDHELLELLLQFSIPRNDTNPLGHQLIEQFGNLQGVFETPRAELDRIPGLGENSAFLLKLIPDITRRYFEQLQNGDLQLELPQDRVRFFAPRFIGHKEECLYAAFLDKNYKLLYCALQYIGSIDAVEIHQDKIVRESLRSGAKMVILAHNHFRDTIPSDQDISATRRLYLALAPYEIEVLDHIVVCGATGTSMKESGHFAKVTY